jgi:hypothetical protein
MARIDLKFLDVYNERDGVNDYIQTEAEEDGLIRIGGMSWNEDLKVSESFCILLDISTAIKFAKTIRTEINKAKEVSNV